MLTVSHICILTSIHPFDDVRVDQKIGRSFLESGLRVSWVGPQIGFPGSRPDPRYEPYLFKPGKGRRGRIGNILRAYRIARRIRGINVFYAPDPDSAYLAVRLARSRGARVIFDIHEMFHEAMLEHWLGVRGSRRFGGIIRFIIARICRKCELVIGVSEAVLKPYRDDLREKIVIRNCATRSFARGIPADVCGVGKTVFSIMHGKNLPLRGTEIVLRALQILKKRTAGIRIVMFEAFHPGSPAERKFRLKIEKAGIKECVDLKSSIPNSDMPSVLAECDVGIITYGRTLGNDSLPNRLFEYMAAGLPVIAPSYAKEIVSVLEEERCGLAVDAENPEALAEAIVFLKMNPERAREMGLRAREGFIQRHNWDIEVSPLIRRIREWTEYRMPG